jgi:hypothetical protein
VKVELHIERLVLDGLPVTSLQRERLSRAVENELRRLLQAGGHRQWKGGAVPSVGSPAFRLAPHGGPEAVGRQIGRAVHDGITGSTEATHPRSRLGVKVK